MLTRDRGTAEDVVQEVLVRTHARWSRIARLERPEQYVRRMTVNEYLSWRRRRARQVPVAAAGVELVDDYDHAATLAEQALLWSDARTAIPG